jgi:hypothetical protein
MLKILKFFSMLLLITSGQSLLAEESKDFKDIFSIIGTKGFFNLDRKEFDQKISKLCRYDGKTYEYNCNKDAGVKFMRLSGDPKDGFLQSAFYEADDCEYVYKFLIKEFGKPKSKKGACKMDWRLPPLKGSDSARYLGIELNPDKKIIYFDIGSDQM